MRTINPHEIVSSGTKIAIKSKLGTIISHRIVPASNGGMITVHTVKLTHIRKSEFAHMMKTVPLKREWTGEVNYTAITILDQ